MVAWLTKPVKYSASNTLCALAKALVVSPSLRAIGALSAAKSCFNLRMMLSLLTAPLAPLSQVTFKACTALCACHQLPATTATHSSLVTILRTPGMLRALLSSTLLTLPPNTGHW